MQCRWREGRSLGPFRAGQSYRCTLLKRTFQRVQAWPINIETVVSESTRHTFSYKRRRRDAAMRNLLPHKSKLHHVRVPFFVVS